jgi:FkbM family methyltransferase
MDSKLINDIVGRLNSVVEVVNQHANFISLHNSWIDKLRFQNELLLAASQSKSQFMQDLFVLKTFSNKRDGYFVEFGATNGVDGSNTYLLESDYGWKGLLSEPARCWGSDLKRNRTARIDTRCVWDRSGELINFDEVDAATLSTASVFSNSDVHSKARKNCVTYEVETVSLLDLLEQHNAPSVIDYLSIDTEGSEYKILAAFDFDRYNIGVITCEHNWSADREKIYALLLAKGYQRVHENLTDCDDWYVKK